MGRVGPVAERCCAQRRANRGVALTTSAGVPEADVATVDAARYLSLTTFRKSGVAVATPVWFARVDDAWYAFSAGDAGKVKRLRNNGDVRVAACDARGRLTGPPFETRAELINHDAAASESAYKALRQRYGWQMRTLDLIAWLGRRLHKRQLIRILRPTGVAPS